MAAIKTLTVIFVALFSFSVKAGVLPEQRADILYHSYDGGGVSINGPSVLVRKNINDKFSLSGNYYVDMVSSASIDVVANASEYTEERTEYSLGMDYLNDRTIMSFSFTNSAESDYIADTLGFTISQEFFGDLSTITLGYSIGDNTVKATGQDIEENAGSKRFKLGFSQILTPNLLVSFGYEAVLDEGFLRNPYRQYRYFDPLSANDFSYAFEIYPNTRNSDAFAIKGIYYLSSFGSSIRAEYRDYSDSWDIKSKNYELRYAHPITPKLLFEIRYRYYQQSEANFYVDLAPAQDFQTFIGRDKELSDYTSSQYGLGISYTFKSDVGFFNNSTLNLYWDHMTFDYNNFSNVTTGAAIGEEPLYSLEANVIRLFFSAYF